MKWIHLSLLAGASVNVMTLAQLGPYSLYPTK